MLSYRWLQVHIILFKTISASNVKTYRQCMEPLNEKFQQETIRSCPTFGGHGTKFQGQFHTARNNCFDLVTKTI